MQENFETNQVRPIVMKRCLYVALLLALPSVGSAQVVINEVSAANYNHTTDNYNEYEDWIELYNTSGTTIDLSGYYLSDRVNNNTKYQIPVGCTIAPYGYKLFWCSGRNTDAGGVYHTSFKLTQCRYEPAVFSSPQANIIDSYIYTRTNQRNHSRGRATDGSSEWAIFLQPTPGGPNVTTAYQEYPDPPVFSHAAGFYPGPVNITLTTNSPGATIRYTLNGTTPTAASPQYTGPIPITQTTVVRAIALNPNPLIPDGFMETNTYFINENFTVPVVSVSGDLILTLLNGQQIEPVGHFEIFDENGTFRDEGLGEYNKHGNDSWAYQQRGIDWITRDEFGYNNEIDYRIFRGKQRRYFQRFILKAGANCNYPFQNGGAHVRDLYVQSLSQMANMELDERTGEFVVMFANGQYWGVYDIREKVDDHDFTEYYYDQKKEDLDFLKTWGGTWAEYGTNADWVALRNFILGNEMTDEANYAYVKTQFNTLSLIDYFIINSYVVASDWLNWNTGWWKGRNPQGGAQQWRYILWDMDAVFGHYINYTGIPNTSASANICFPEALNNPGGQGHVPIWNKLLTSEEFQMEYINRISDMSNSYFSCEFMIGHLDSLINIMNPEMPRQIQRWGGNMNTWQNNVQSIYNFIEIRCAQLNNNILDCYDWLDGPYEVTVNVEPANGGKVKVNTITPDNYPFIGQYFGGINQNYEALARPGFAFSHWTVGDLVITPSTTSTEITFALSADAELTAHFEPTFLFDITFEVIPEGAGNITINGVLRSEFPHTEELGAAVEHALMAQASPGFLFNRWEVSIPNTFGPDVNEFSGIFQVGFTGTVKAYFLENNHPIMFEVQPEGTGTIALDGEIFESYPEIKSLPADFAYNLEAATVLPFHKFTHWSSTHHAFLPDSAQALAQAVFTQGDVVIAHFTEMPNYTITFLTNPKDIGAIRFGNQTLSEFPYTERYLGNVPYALESVVPNKWEFSHWEFVMRPNHSGTRYPSLQYTAERNDTIILHMTERFSEVFVPSAFTPNGDGINELVRVQGPDIAPEDFEWVIYSRWGDLVFKSTDINNAWNGDQMGSGYYCPVGIYTWHLRFRNAITRQNETRMGSIMLIR